MIIEFLVATDKINYSGHNKNVHAKYPLSLKKLKKQNQQTKPNQPNKKIISQSQHHELEKNPNHVVLHVHMQFFKIKYFSFLA